MLLCVAWRRSHRLRARIPADHPPPRAPPERSAGARGRRRSRGRHTPRCQTGVVPHDLRARSWAVRLSGTLRVRVERWGGAPVLDSPGAALLEAAGFVRATGAMLWIGARD